MTRVLVLRAAGTNCDEETAHAFRLAGGDVETVHVAKLVGGGGVRLDDFEILVVPGGFSYGDDLGAGTVLGNRLRASLSDDLREFVASGRLVLGICNGFQVLVRLGLLPGWDDDSRPVSLVINHSGKFEDRWVRLRVESPQCPFLRTREELAANAGDDAATLRLPVAHAEGRFTVRDAAVLERLRAHGQIALTYVPLGEDEEATATDRYPDNPNGSAGAIAGITNAAGNVLGLMPHPERHLRTLHDPEWTRQAWRTGLPDDELRAGDGFGFFDRAVRSRSFVEG